MQVMPEDGARPANRSEASAGSTSSPVAETVADAAKGPYPPVYAIPTQEAPAGIRFDFNAGARVRLPRVEDHLWRVRLRDLDSGNILFESENKGASVSSAKRWFVRFRIEVWSRSSNQAVGEGAAPFWVHDWDARQREVLIQFPVGTLGDTLAWMPYAARFAEQSGARVTCAMSGTIMAILQPAYPDMRFVTHETLVEQKLLETFYATYSLGLFFNDKSCDWQPIDFRHVGLHRTAGYILGVSPDEEPARIALTDDSCPIDEPYVCIAVQASTRAKTWNNPSGWRAVIAHLKERGYRVICIDQRPVHGDGLVWNHIPHGAEDETGDRPLAERARWLRHAAAFIGLSSGLSWLAWAAGCPVVLISGFTLPSNEFTTAGRVINWHSCNGCWNDPRLSFDHHDFLWCPRHAGTPRQFECTRLITPESVIVAADRMLATSPRQPARRA